jgi:hypothetical protein
LAWANQTDESISQAIRRLIAFPQGETTVNFDGLYDRAREILKDNHGLMYFRNLDDVESRLNTKAKQS